MTDTSLTTKPAAIPTVNDYLAGVTADGTVKLFQVGNLPAQESTVDTTYVDTQDQATLNSANAHSDSNDAVTLAAANAHADTGDSTTLTSANSHADTGDATTLASANSHADTGDAATLNSAKAYTDSSIAGVSGGGVSSTYVDAGDASTLSSANSHSDANDTATLNAAKAYTDSSIGSSGTAPNYTAPSTGAVGRSLNSKLAETEVSVVDYGADPTGVADSTAAFNNALHSGKYRIHIPAGTYKITNWVIDRSCFIYGDGQNKSIINVTTTTTHGMQIIGESALATGNLIRMQGFKLNYIGAGQPTTANWSGMYIQRKVYMDEVWVRNFTNDGIYFAPGDADEATGNRGTIGKAVFFAKLENVWSKDNGRDGLVIRMGANANTFINLQLSGNKRYGLHHLTDGNDQAGAVGSTYGNTIISGQASYNSNIGYYFENGTSITCYGLYAEYNGSPTNSNTDGYVNTPYDFFIGDNCNHSAIYIGTPFGGNATHIRAPASGLNDSNGVFCGGDRVFGSAFSHQPHEVTTFSALLSTATLSDVINQCNLIRTKLQTAGVVQ
jgi:hypothetical protein